MSLRLASSSPTIYRASMASNEGQGVSVFAPSRALNLRKLTFPSLLCVCFFFSSNRLYFLELLFSAPLSAFVQLLKWRLPPRNLLCPNLFENLSPHPFHCSHTHHLLSVPEQIPSQPPPWRGGGARFPPKDSTLCFSCYAQGVYTYIKIFNIDIISWREKGNVQFYFFYIVLYIYI